MLDATVLLTQWSYTVGADAYHHLRGKEGRREVARKGHGSEQGGGAICSQRGGGTAEMHRNFA